MNVFVVADPRLKELPVIDEKIIRNYSFPFGEMAREMIEASSLKNDLFKNE